MPWCQVLRAVLGGLKNAVDRWRQIYLDGDPDGFRAPRRRSPWPILWPMKRQLSAPLPEDLYDETGAIELASSSDEEPLLAK